MSRMKTSLPESLAATVKSTISDWQSGGKVKRLWDRDASLWTGEDESKWLGWLDVVDEQLAQHDQLQKFAKDVHNRGFEHILLLGMGGSSLCPEVLRMTFGRIPHFPTLHVLDSTDPAQVKAFEHQVDFAKTLFIVSSKSGSTLEPNIFKQYFFERAKQMVGHDKVGSHFIAITDPGSKMQQVAKATTSCMYFSGGRRSADATRRYRISGWSRPQRWALIPRSFWTEQRRWKEPVAQDRKSRTIPELFSGLFSERRRMPDATRRRLSPLRGISDLGAWLEQLIAESTGKIGKGIIPVDREHLSSPAVYGNDRVFAYIRLENEQTRIRTQKSLRWRRPGIPLCASHGRTPTISAPNSSAGRLRRR